MLIWNSIFTRLHIQKLDLTEFKGSISNLKNLMVAIKRAEKTINVHLNNTNIGQLNIFKHMFNFASIK
ncbi:hypothetical protein BpHYR1_022037 [Brachionus plicatilis]|uniref:Uncharacterized protein n=1 Tax=Brachionus plicatilis TaxID=10195 RepID=A0A3M7SC00_BRAPC|nr:hypothetical protein BpHYR1_022037 [Brachionus plicatilis]